MKVMTLVGLVLTVALVSCQSVPSAGAKGDLEAVRPTSIAVGDVGYYPLTQASHSFLVFNLTFERPDLVRSWSVQWKDQAGTTVYEIVGAPPFLPATLTWDGRRGDGSWAASGLYSAALFVDYGDKKTDVLAASETFRLAPTPELQPDNFSIPVNDTEDGPDCLE